MGTPFNRIRASDENEELGPIWDPILRRRFFTRRGHVRAWAEMALIWGGATAVAVAVVATMLAGANPWEGVMVFVAGMVLFFLVVNYVFTR